MLEHVSRDKLVRIHSLSRLQDIFEEKLKKVTRFLLVLDDIWELNDAECWETLLDPMNFELLY